MTWSERIKLAWRTFTREALPLYAWSLIFAGVGFILAVAIVWGILSQEHWSFPQAFSEFYSPGMPIPGVPPLQEITPYSSPFGSFNGSMNEISSLLTAIGTIAGTLIFLMIIVWLLTSAFCTGIFNLTARSYQQKANFKDFRMTGFFRCLGWQAFLFIIQLVFLGIGLLGAFSLRFSQGALITFCIIYGLVLSGIVIFTLPWLASSLIYLLAHPEDRFRAALNGSWKFFRRHTGTLWGYIGTVLLIEIAFHVLNRISSDIATLASFVISPFIAVLAIVWVFSLEEDERNCNMVPNTDTPPPYCTISSLESQGGTITPPAYRPAEPPLYPECSPLEDPVSDLPELETNKKDFEVDSNFCPSCGRANTGTAYCPQCGTKL